MLVLQSDSIADSGNVTVSYKSICTENIEQFFLPSYGIGATLFGFCFAAVLILGGPQNLRARDKWQFGQSALFDNLFCGEEKQIKIIS